MKKEYDLLKLKKRNHVKVDPSSEKIPLSIRLEGDIVAWFKSEAEKLGIPYQTLIGSTLHRFATGQLVEQKNTQFLKRVSGE